MRKVLVMIACITVIAANLWVFISAQLNRSETPGGGLELTERELRLQRVGGESTALFLRLEWDVISDEPNRQDRVAWMNEEKLEALGFDCSVPVSAPKAEDFYRSRLARTAYLVLEYEGDAWKGAPANRPAQTRLFVIDAGLNPGRLREQYNDSERHIITRGVVNVSFEKGNLSSPPRLWGRIERVLPDRIFVPRPHNHMLHGLSSENASREDPTWRAPRFAATIYWGRNHEPWLSQVRLLPTDEQVR